MIGLNEKQKKQIQHLNYLKARGIIGALAYAEDIKKIKEANSDGKKREET